MKMMMMGKRDLGVGSTPFTYVAHVLGIASVLMVLIWCINYRGGFAWEATNKSLIFNLHPALMLIGFIFLGSEAILAYRVLPGSKLQRKAVHLSLHLIALVLGILGIYMAFKYHNESSIANLYSLHSWLGLATISLYAIQWVAGFVSFWFPGGPDELRAAVLPWHVMFGIFIYVLTLVTAVLGFLEKLTFLENSGLSKYGAEALLVNFTAVVVVLFGGFVVISSVANAPPTNDEVPYRPLLAEE